MKPEKFNPSNPEYKKIEDLPREHQAEFTNVEGGFVRKSAAEESEKKPIYGGKENKPRYGSKYSYWESVEEKALGMKNYVENRDFFINEAPQLIRGNDFDKGIVPVAEKLGVKIYTDRYAILNTTESLLDKVLGITNNFDKDAQPLLDAVATSLMQLDIHYRPWSHTVCHLVESYGQQSSLLDTPQSREVLTKLVDESVRRQKKEIYDIGCSDRILNPIFKFNLIEAGTDNLEQPYVYKPESLRDGEYIRILKMGLRDEYSYNLKAFLDSSSPLECYRLILENGKELSYFLNPEQQIELLQALEKHLPHELINKFVERVYNPNGKSVTYDELLKSFKESKESQEAIKGVYVDVEGTLIKEFKGKRNLDEQLVKKLKKLYVEGHEIIIFTGGDVDVIETELKKFGFPEHFLPVRSKNDYRGKVLEILIDDTPPEYQGFRALELRSHHGFDAWE